MWGCCPSLPLRVGLCSVLSSFGWCCCSFSSLLGGAALVTLGLKSVAGHANGRMPPHTDLLPRGGGRCPELRRWREPTTPDSTKRAGLHQGGRAWQINKWVGTPAPAQCRTRRAPDANSEQLQQCFHDRCCASVPGG